MTISLYITRLKQGLISGDLPLAHKASVDLFENSSTAIPLLQNELEKIKFDEIERPSELRLFGGLLSLLRILDEKASDIVIHDALAMKLSPTTLSVLNSTKRFSSDSFRISTYGKIDIYESKDLDKAFQASQYVGKWLANVPQEDLIGIPRIYIEPEDAHTRYLGTYEPHIACIKLAWQANYRFRNPINPLLRFSTEITLYHEIGHHFNKHSYGQDPQQEKEADNYSYKIIREVYPRLNAFGKFCRKLFKQK